MESGSPSVRANNLPFPFLSLPPELRELVYKFHIANTPSFRGLFGAHTDIMWPRSPSSARRDPFRCAAPVHCWSDQHPRNCQVHSIGYTGWQEWVTHVIVHGTQNLRPRRPAGVEVSNAESF